MQLFVWLIEMQSHPLIQSRLNWIQCDTYIIAQMSPETTELLFSISVVCDESMMYESMHIFIHFHSNGLNTAHPEKKGKIYTRRQSTPSAYKLSCMRCNKFWQFHEYQYKRKHTHMHARTHVKHTIECA